MNTPITELKQLKYWTFHKETNTLIFDGQELVVNPHSSQLYAIVDELYSRDGIDAVPVARELGEIYFYVERISPPPADPVLEREYLDDPSFLGDGARLALASREESGAWYWEKCR